MKYFANRPTKATRPLSIVRRSDLAVWLKKQNKKTREWLQAQSFEAKPGQIAYVYGTDKTIEAAVTGIDDDTSPFTFAHLPAGLAEARYAFDDTLEEADADRAALGWALGTYVFDRYKKSRQTFATVVWPKDADRAEVERLAKSTFIARDLITTPAGDLGPTALAAFARKMAREMGARCSVIRGNKLLEKNYPAIHAVGRAAADPPCLIDITWGRANAPKVTLVGKGVCFDTGGLDIKPASGMLLMKKDMGGAAMVLALGRAVMDAELDVRLRILVPAVENSIAGNAFHPQDVLQTRKGLTVEVGNTDAEGRLILCDALAAADSESPDMIIDFATLTGAARVALGTELPALFSNNDDLAKSILGGGLDVGDPLWRLPLHQPYRRALDSSIADLNNVGSGRFGGAITAALFLQAFVSSDTWWAHIDLMGYNSERRPGRPVGGEAMGIRAVYEMLKEFYG